MAPDRHGDHAHIGVASANDIAEGNYQGHHSA
jgi:hypothetical protein